MILPLPPCSSMAPHHSNTPHKGCSLTKYTTTTQNLTTPSLLARPPALTIATLLIHKVCTELSAAACPPHMAQNHTLSPTLTPHPLIHTCSIGPRCGCIRNQLQWDKIVNPIPTASPLRDHPLISTRNLSPLLDPPWGSTQGPNHSVIIDQSDTVSTTMRTKEAVTGGARDGLYQGTVPSRGLPYPSGVSPRLVMLH